MSGIGLSEFERRLGAALARHDTAVGTTALESRCGECHGVGAVLDPEWAAWHAQEAETLTLCVECGGAGSVPTETGRALLDFLRRHLTL